MAIVVKKRGKYMTGHSYATGIGYSFSWDANIGKARRFADDEVVVAESLAGISGGKIITVPNFKRELRKLGKRMYERPVSAVRV